MSILGTGEAAVALPEMAEDDAEPDLERRNAAIRSRLGSSLSRVTILSVPTSLAFLFLGPELVTTLLRKRGHKVTAVENGRKAVASVRSAKGQAFDVVLMDLQMPEMGGFEAAQAIRAWEKERVPSTPPATGRRLPVIALTAHAMQGDRERCLQSGMDGYLSKPVDVDELIATVERFGGGRPSQRVVSPPQQGDGSIFDERAALSYSGSDRRLLKNVIALFRSDYPSALRRIDRALRQRIPKASWRHGLKGRDRDRGCTAGRRAAAEIEQAAACRTSRSRRAHRSGCAMSSKGSRRPSPPRI
jgi:CheY-like chemotaxis protein